MADDVELEKQLREVEMTFRQSQKLRIFQFFHIFTMTSTYVQAQELARMVGVSDRTVKSDMPMLRDFALASGCKLLSKKSKGYYLEVLDEELYLPVKQQLNYRFATERKDRVFSLARSYGILRRLICCTDYLSYEQLAEEVYLAKTVLQSEMGQVVKILDSYHLRLRKKSESGEMVVGAEFEKRVLMVQIYEMHYHEGMTFFPYTAYTEYIECEKQVLYDIRHLLLELLRQYDISIPDVHTQMLSRYLVLCNNRRKAGFQLQFSKEQKDWLQAFGHYQLAADFFIKAKAEFGFEADEEEIMGLAILLIIWEDLKEDINVPSGWQQLTAKAEEYLGKIQERLLSQCGLDFSTLPNWKGHLLNFLQPYCAALHLNAHTWMISQEINGNYEYLIDSPLCLWLAKQALDVFDGEAPRFSIMALAQRFHSLLESVQLKGRPLRALLVSQNGFSWGNTIKARIQARFPKAFSIIDVKQLYELRGLLKEDYDIAFLNLSSHVYKYEWPTFYLDSIPTTKQFNDIYNQVLVDSLNLLAIEKKLGLHKLRIYENFSCETIETFFQLLAFKLGVNSKEIERLEQYFSGWAQLFFVNRHCLLFLSAQNEAGLLELYHFQKAKMYHSHLIEDVLLLKLDFAGNANCARVLQLILEQYCKDDTAVLRLLKKEPGVLDGLLRQAIKSQVISFT